MKIHRIVAALPLCLTLSFAPGCGLTLVESDAPVTVATAVTEVAGPADAEENIRYVSSLEQISDEDLAQMDARARYLIGREFSDDKEELSGVTGQSVYLLTRREEADPDDEDAQNANMLYLIYFVSVNKILEEGESENDYDEVTYFWCGQYRNLTLDSDGNLIFDADAMSSFNRHFSTEYKIHNDEINVDIVRTHSGYEEFSDLYDRIVIQNQNNYAYETEVFPDLD